MAQEEFKNICSICHQNRDSIKISPGEIHVRCGPMFCGKTTFLKWVLERDYELSVLAEIELPIVYVNSKLDTRANLLNVNDNVTSHNPLFEGISKHIKQIKVDSLDQLDVKNVKILGIDEYQLYKGDPNNWVSHFANCLGIECWCLGLVENSRQKPFGILGELLYEATTFEKINNARCLDCIKEYKVTNPNMSLNDINRFPACFTISKMSLDGQQIKIGGADIYKPVCRKHRNKGVR